MSPSAPGQGPDTSDCIGEAPVGAQRWCLRWVRYTATPPQGAPSHWTTACSVTRTADEYAVCQAVTLTLNTRPPTGTPSVLADVPSGTAPSTDLVRCALFTDQATAHPDQADAWTALHDRCVAAAPALLQALRPQKIVGAAGDSCDTLDQQCRIEKALKDAVAAGIRTGISGLTDFFVQAVGYMLSLLAKMVLTKTSIGSPDEAFFFSYNAAAGILIVLVFIYFIWATIINGLRVQGPGPVATLGGLVRAILGITLAGGIAWTVVAAWDEATNALIDYNADTGWDASLWLTAFTALAGEAGAGALVLVVAIFALIGLALLFIMMTFRGLLTTGAALLGAMAMSGQVKEETRPWARTWFWTVNALAASKFFITLFWIYGTRAAYGSDDFTTVLQAVLLIWLMVLCPGIMLRLTSIFDAYLSDVNSRGLVTAAAAGIGDLATRGADAAMQRLGGRNGGGDATELMDANIAEMPTDPGQTGGDIEPDEGGDAGDGGGDEDPGSGLEQVAGLEDGPVDDATKAVETGQDGGRPGDPSQAGGPATGSTDGAEPETAEAAGQPHAGEAADTEGAARSARHDLGSGELTAPGQTGDSGAVPLSPDAVAASASGNGADPTGVDPAAADRAGAGPTGAKQTDGEQTGAAAQAGGDGAAGSGGLPGSPDSVGLGPAGSPPGGPDPDGDPGQPGAGDPPPDPPEPGPGGGTPSGGGGPSAGPSSGGGGAAAGSAEELAVVAV
ncbi:hypothetical protein ACQP2P_15760 [Dactylosporangium sp. CA-139114]|uniref:hypothetical protein n=1 Tax=Dactylosporangium sp. CA-139114 TaxID=3239931 RepID=UPI003D9603B0